MCNHIFIRVLTKKDPLVTFAVGCKYITFVWVVPPVYVSRQPLGAVFWVALLAHSYTMSVFKIQGAVPKNGVDPVGRTQRQNVTTTMSSDTDLFSKTLPVSVDQDAGGHMGPCREEADQGQHGMHVRPTFTETMDDDVYMELMTLVGNGVINTLKSMLMAGLNGDLKTAERLREEVGATITCFPQQGDTPCVVSWYEVLKHCITFVNYYRQMHRSGAMDDVTWPCPRCKKRKHPDLKRQPRTW